MALGLAVLALRIRSFVKICRQICKWKRAARRPQFVPYGYFLSIRKEIGVGNETQTWRLVQNVYTVKIKPWALKEKCRYEIYYKILNIVNGHKKGVSDRKLINCEMSIYTICTLHQISQDDDIEQERMGWTYSTHARVSKCIQIVGQEPEDQRWLERPKLNGKIILKRVILYAGVIWLCIKKNYWFL
jgi:hypothetical protein